MRALVGILVLGIAAPSFGQSNLEVRGTVVGQSIDSPGQEGIPLSKAVINKYINQAVVGSASANNKGEFNFNVPFDVVMDVEFKCEGYGSKWLQINTNSVPENERHYGFEYSGFRMTLISGVEFKEPLIILEYDKMLGVFQHIINSRIQLPLDSNYRKYGDYFVVDDLPRFPGCEEIQFNSKEELQKCADSRLYEYIAKNIVHPDEAKTKNLSGRVYAYFIIETDGTITNANILTGLCGECDQNVLRLIESMPKWKPAKYRGELIKFKYYLPINFVTSPEFINHGDRKIIKSLSHKNEDEHYIKATSFFDQKKYDVAKSEIDQAWRGEPTNPKILYLRAEIYYELGDAKNACKIYAKAQKYGATNAEERIKERCN